jgi:hypothetical protein
MERISIFYCLYFWDSPNLEGQVPVFISDRNRVAYLNPRAWGESISRSQSYITPDGQSASLSWCQAPIWYPRPCFLLLSLITFGQLLICWCGAPSLMRSRVCSFQFLLGIASEAFLRSESHGTDEHISSSSSYIATDCQSASSSWCRTPFAADNQRLRLLQSGWSRSRSQLRPTVSRPVRLDVLPLLEQVTRCYAYLSGNYFLYFSCRAPSRGQVLVFISPTNRVAQLYPPSIGLLMSIFYCLYFWDSPKLREGPTGKHRVTP